MLATASRSPETRQTLTSQVIPDMPIVIRSGHLELDKQAAINTFIQYLNPLYDAARFDWVYRQNPYGLGRLWLATDTGTGAIVGIAGASPRRIYLAGRELIAWALGDFCISGKYRSLGPALQLQRACLAEVDAGTVALCYDFPAAGFMAVYRRLNIPPLGQMVRLAKPLRADRQLGAMDSVPWAMRRLRAAANLLLALPDWASRSAGIVTIALHDGNCGPEFSLLAQEIADQHGACIRRSADYLNWRYLANPLCPCELVTARRHDALLAYAVFTCKGRDATLMDLFGRDDPAAISALISGLVALLRARGMVTVSAPILAPHPWLDLLQRKGFRRRETTPVVIYNRATPENQPANSPRKSNWFLMHGDRDS